MLLFEFHGWLFQFDAREPQFDPVVPFPPNSDAAHLTPLNPRASWL